MSRGVSGAHKKVVGAVHILRLTGVAPVQLAMSAVSSLNSIVPSMTSLIINATLPPSLRTFATPSAPSATSLPFPSTDVDPSLPFIGALGPLFLSNSTVTCTPVEVAFGGGVPPYKVRYIASATPDIATANEAKYVGSFKSAGSFKWKPCGAVGQFVTFSIMDSGHHMGISARRTLLAGEDSRICNPIEDKSKATEIVLWVGGCLLVVAVLILALRYPNVLYSPRVYPEAPQAQDTLDVAEQGGSLESLKDRKRVISEV